MQQTISAPSNVAGSTEEHFVDRVKDDMASRRISSHIPAPLRKKKNEDQYKRFITPSGNPVVYLQQHMRSKSMSDLADEENDERSHRAEINERYEEMEKLKVLLKEEEETWTSKLQTWKSRRKSVTEDARKRKEERDILEKEAEAKSGRRRTKTYREIVQDKMRREDDLSRLQDHDDAFVSPRSSASGTSSSVHLISTMSHKPFDSESKSEKHKDSVFNPSRAVKELEANVSPAFTNFATHSSPKDPNIQYKYTSKVTAIIGDAHSHTGSSCSDTVISTPKTDLEETSYENPVTQNSIKKVDKRYTLPWSHTSNAEKEEQKSKDPQTSKTSVTLQMGLGSSPKSKVPNVLMRVKNPNARKERPKSDHELHMSGRSTWSNYHSTPKPFVPGGKSFAHYRKTAFANRRNMWENISTGQGKTEDAPVEPEANLSSKPPDEKVISNNEVITSQEGQSVSSSPQSQQSHKDHPMSKTYSESKAKFLARTAPFTLTTGSQKNKIIAPAKVPLVTKADVAGLTYQMSRHPSLDTSQHIDKYADHTATLTPSGLTMTLPAVSKSASLPKMGDNSSTEGGSLFDDMKICINQRPRSEKGFGFTVRGGDDGKPVIVDTVSPGGAADICHLCVSDEILAINEVPLADCKTQDDIVQLIVSSVITGHLSLNIRRYGKMNKVNPLRLTGTKVVMTPGGFVQVRSDKSGMKDTHPRTVHGAKYFKQLSLPTSAHTRMDANNNQEFFDDLPPPPTQQELMDANQATHVDDNKRTSRTSTSLISETSQYSHSLNDDNVKDDTSEQVSDESNGTFEGDALSEVHSNHPIGQEDENELQKEVESAQKALEFEEVYEHYDKQRREEEQQLRLKLQEQQRKLEEEDAQREEARQKLLEEARLEDIRVEEELRRIKAMQRAQQQHRREREQTQGFQLSPGVKNVKTAPRQRTLHTNGIGGIATHWMIEEAERRRIADLEEKPRISPMEYGRQSDNRVRGGLPDHVIQRLTERTSRGHVHNPMTPEPMTHKWHDSGAKATLL